MANTPDAREAAWEEARPAYWNGRGAYCKRSGKLVYPMCLQCAKLWGHSRGEFEVHTQFARTCNNIRARSREKAYMESLVDPAVLLHENCKASTRAYVPENIS